MSIENLNPAILRMIGMTSPFKREVHLSLRSAVNFVAHTSM
jgi:hypothetical protein